MKKALKITLYALPCLIFLAVLSSYIRYNTYRAKDPEIKADPANLSYYHESYTECREAFIRNFDVLRTVSDSLKTGKIQVQSRTDDSLYIDWCYIPARKEKKKLLILNSGLHGIEGYAGSAIQDMFIEKILKQQLPDDMGVLIIHGLNPYGFKYHRKATENNVDLNRNCILEGQSFHIENAGYARLEDMLMPSKPVNINNPGNRFFYFTAIYKITRESMPVLRQAALQGQYNFDKGIYYGGKTYEPQIQALKPFLTDKIRQYKMVLNVDLHTGYGKRGTLHLFIDKPEDPKVLHGIEKIFKGNRIDWGSSSDFYTISGEYTSWANNLVPGVLCIPMLIEFGTLDTQKTFGSLKSIQIMILENEGAHYGYKNKNNEMKTMQLFDEMYYPSSPVWRSKVISDSYKLMSGMMNQFRDYSVE
jgi:hypothetical protein